MITGLIVTLVLPLVPPCDVHLADLQRFPPGPLVAATLADNGRAYLDCLTRQGMEPYRADDWEVVISDFAAIRRAWVCLRTARCAEVDADERLEALRELRDVIGPANYLTGAMPPPVPVWRFGRVD